MNIPLPYLWLLAAAIFVVVEILPPATHFVFLALAVGALFASAGAAFFRIAWLPWTVFVVVSAGLMPVLVPLAKFLFATKSRATDIPMTAGEKAVVLEPIHPATPGLVQLRGEEWRATSESDSFEKDEQVEVSRVEELYVVVRRPKDA